MTRAFRGRFQLLLLAIVGIAICGSAPLARASLLDFSPIALPNGSAIPQEYGDNLPGTPNIAVAYRTVDANSNSLTTLPDIYFWDVGYGDLTNVAYGGNFNFGEVALIAEPGYAVRLVSFDMAGYQFNDVINQTVQVLDGSYNELAKFSPITIAGTGPAHSSFIFFNGLTAPTIRIQFGASFNLGIDNILFEQVAVPEPMSAALGGMALAGFGFLAWKQRKAARGTSVASL